MGARDNFRLMLFDLYHGGHHGQHVRVLVDHWIRRGMKGSLDVVVSREFCERYPDLVASADHHDRVSFHPTRERVQLEDKKGRTAVLRNDLRIGRLLRTAIDERRPDHCVLMYFDHLQLSLATDLRFDHPVRFSGTYFRPSFYYHQRSSQGRSLGARLDDFQKRTLLRKALANPHFETLFTLDPYAVEPIARLQNSAQVVHLPEPFEAGQNLEGASEETRRRLGVEADREMLLLFGALDPRKGVLQLLDGLQRLPAELAQRACLVMAGETVGIRNALERAVAELRARSGVQVVHLDEFVTDDEMHSLFGCADLVLMPYQRHVGSSGVLVRAAAAGKPVLGQRYGLLGQLIEDRGLGVCVDTTSPAAIAAGLSLYLDPKRHFPFDPARARLFADENTEESMAGTLLARVIPDPENSSASNGRRPAPAGASIGER